MKADNQAWTPNTEKRGRVARVKMSKIETAVAVVCLLLISNAHVIAQGVTVTQLETRLTRRTTSDRQGDYVLALLPVGHYRLEVDAAGFRRYLRQGIVLSVNQIATVPVRLVVGSAQQSVEVRADAAPVQTTNDLGETVHGREI